MCTRLQHGSESTMAVACLVKLSESPRWSWAPSRRPLSQRVDCPLMPPCTRVEEEVCTVAVQLRIHPRCRHQVICNTGGNEMAVTNPSLTVLIKSCTSRARELACRMVDTMQHQLGKLLPCEGINCEIIIIVNLFPACDFLNTQ